MNSRVHLSFDEIKTKWEPVLDHPDLSPIADTYKRNVTALMLETTDLAVREGIRAGNHIQVLSEDPIPSNFIGGSSSTPGTGGIDTFDPVLITMVRRLIPNLMAYDVMGVQPMTGPTGLIFCLRPRYSNQQGNETWYDEVKTGHSNPTATGANTFGQKQTGYLPGSSTQNANLAEAGLYNAVVGMSTAQGEALGTDGNTAWPEVAFSIDRNTVEAKTRALKAEYTMEIAQDLKAIHGLDIETELSHMLSTELLAEINRQLIRTVNYTAKPGCVESTAAPGFFDLDTDSNGRWLIEKFKGLLFQVEREANRLAKETRRGKGNIIICSSDVASAFMMTGLLDYKTAISAPLQVDDTGNTFAGILLGRYKVYVDPYADAVLNGTPGLNYMTVGYKGQNAYDAGIFYCPYIPLTSVKATDPGSFHAKMGFKTRFGVVANPFAQGSTDTNQGVILKDSNVFYRRSIIKNII